MLFLRESAAAGAALQLQPKWTRRVRAVAIAAILLAGSLLIALRWSYPLLSPDSDSSTDSEAHSPTPPVLIGGIVVDIDGQAVAGARVSVMSYGEESVITGEDGQFVLPAHAAYGNEVHLRAEKADYLPAEEWPFAGDRSVYLKLKRNEEP